MHGCQGIDAHGLLPPLVKQVYDLTFCEKMRFVQALTARFLDWVMAMVPVQGTQVRIALRDPT